MKRAALDGIELDVGGKFGTARLTSKLIGAFNAENLLSALGALLAAGIVCWVTLEAIINIAVMVGILPFAGNALPFISYGGSSLVVNLSAMGVLLSISRREQRDEAIPRRTRNSGLLRRMLGQERTRRDATHDFSRRDRRGRVSRVVSRSGDHS